MAATDVYSVIAGEAVTGTPEQRYNDMLGIASVIANRARMLGVSVDDVISSGEFGAYGKPLPPGADQYVSLAEKAMNDVMQNGPVNNATFYATPSAAKNLPDGLQMEAETQGHQFFSDPAMRPISTAQGFVKPSPVLAGNALIDPTQTQTAAESAISGILSTPVEKAMNVPSLLSPSLVNPAIGEQQPAQGLLGDFSPAALASYNAQPTGYNRPYPASDVVNSNIQAAVTSVLGPGASVQVTSGQEGGLSQFGSNRHKTGLAADVQITAPDGHVLSLNNPADAQAMKDIAQSAATQQANIGLGYLNSPSMMHIDYVPASQLSPGQDQSWGIIGNDPEFAKTLDEARQYSLMPSSFYEAANQRVIDAGIVPTLNSEQGFTQAQDTGGLLGLVNPVSVTPVESASLPDVTNKMPVLNSFAPVAAADPVIGPVNNFSPQAIAMQQQVEKNLADMTKQPASLPSFDSLMANKVQTQAISEQAQDPTQQAISGPYAANGLLNSVTSAVPSPPMSVLSTPMPASDIDPAFSPSGLLSGVPQNTGMFASSPTPSSNATIEGPATTPAVTQQTVQNVQRQSPTVTGNFPSAPVKSSPFSGIFSKEAITGGVLGSLAAGPVGGILGGILGRQVANNGGLTGLLGGQPISVNNIGGGLQNVASVYGGAPVGTQANTNNGGFVTAMNGGWTAYTNPYGVTTTVSPQGQHASYFGPAIGTPSTPTGDPTGGGGLGSVTDGMSPGLF